MRSTQQVDDLTESLTIALRKNVARMTEEDLLDLLVKKLDFAKAQMLVHNGAEARYTESVAWDIRDLLKLRIKRLR